MVANDRAGAEGKLDEAIEESFPASDPPANTIATGAAVRPEADDIEHGRESGPSGSKDRPET